MDRSNLNSKAAYLDFEQLKKYARDLTEVYKSEKEKRSELELANRQLEKYADDLNKTILNLKTAHEELRHAYLETMHRLVLAAEYKDEDTGRHIIRMSRYSALVAEKLGLPTEEVKTILYAAPMHDVGKIGIPDKILLKPGKLTNEEFEIVKTHATIGAEILANSNSEIIQAAQQIAISHHEKWNGKGYPRGLMGNEIPLVGRIVSIADVFDALIHRRPYKDPIPVEQACHIIKREKGEHFDPDVVDVFFENIDGILRIKTEVDSAKESEITKKNL